MKKKKPWRYMDVKDAISEDGVVFPATKKRRAFKLPWRVMGKGLDSSGPVNQASGLYCK
jgi:hypothetical protein